MIKDIHAPRIEALAHKGDWAALVRYWMAHEHQPAFMAAQRVMRQAGTDGNTDYVHLAEYLEAATKNPTGQQSQLPEGIIIALPDVERNSIEIAILNSSLVASAGLRGDGQSRQQWRISAAAAGSALILANQLKDIPLCAHFTRLFGRIWGSHDTVQASLRLSQALKIYRRLARPDWEIYAPEVARTLLELGRIHHQSNNREAALARYEEASEILCGLAETSDGKYDIPLANALNCLGCVWEELGENEEAIFSLGEAVKKVQDHQCRTKNVPPVFWSIEGFMLNDLARVLRKLNQVDASRACSEAAFHCYRALCIVRFGDFLPHLANTLNGLGNVLRVTNNLEKAKHRYRGALYVFRKLARQSPDVYLPQVAMALKNLGLVLSELGEPEKALGVIKESVEVRRELVQKKPNHYLSDLASSLTTLGNIQSQLNNSKQALHCQEEALGIQKAYARRIPKRSQVEVVSSLNNVARVQLDLGKTKEAVANLKKAVRICRGLMPSSTQLPNLALTLISLGLAEIVCGRLRSARLRIHEGLEMYRLLHRKHPPVYRSALAWALNSFGSVLFSGRKLVEARRCYEEAAQLYAAEAADQPAALLGERWRCWLNLGILLRHKSAVSALPDFPAARNALREARKVVEFSRGRFEDLRLRHHLQGETWEIYELLSLTCLDLTESETGQEALRELVEVAEAGRARQLCDLLAEEALSPNNTPPELSERFRNLRWQMGQAQRRLEEEESRKFRVELSGSNGLWGTSGEPSFRTKPGGVRAPTFGRQRLPSPDPLAELESMRSQLSQLSKTHEDLLAQIRRHDPEFNPDQPIPPVTLSEVQEFLRRHDQTALVQYTIARETAFAVVVTHNKVLPIRLRDFNQQQCAELAQAWLANYHKFLKDTQTVSSDSLKARFESWGVTLAELLGTAANRVVHPLVDVVKEHGIKRLVLVPHRALHVFPLHASKLPSGRYLQDDFEIIYAPSFSSLLRCAARQRMPPDKLFLICNPSGDLPFSELEGKSIERRFHPCPDTTRGNTVTDTLFEQSRESNVWHYTGHAFFHPSKPLESALIFGHGDPKFGRNRLTLRDVFCRLDLGRNSLCVLNGCESGMLLPDRTDDYLSLPLGFIYAGATCVVSTLWKVDDLPSALLMDKFYALWRDEHGNVVRSPASALHEAQRWLREDIRSGRELVDEILPPLLEGVDKATARFCKELAGLHTRRSHDSPPFQSPAYWAPFVCTGMGF